MELRTPLQAPAEGGVAGAGACLINNNQTGNLNFGTTTLWQPGVTIWVLFDPSASGARATPAAAIRIPIPS